MESWKTRTLMLLTTMAMVLAISIPVAAQADSCPPWDENCDSQSGSCPPWDENCGSRSDDCPPWDENCGSRSDNCPPWDENCDPQSDRWGDHSDDGLVDTFWVAGAQCFVTYDRDDGGIDETVCFDKAGNVVWEG
jgi:hypothetical protein